MAFTDVWDDLREACTEYRGEVTLLTPSSRRRFAIEAVEPDRIVVAFPDEATERSLRRDQFEVLVDRLESVDDGLDLGGLPPGVEPYVTVLSLSDQYAVDADGAGGRLRADGAASQNPLVIADAPEPTPPERVHDDLLLLADLLERYDVRDPTVLSTERLADLYVLLSDVQRGADEFRRAARDVLLERIGPEGRLHGRYGTVRRTVRERRHAKPDEAVFAELDAKGVPREWVLGVDPDKLDVVLAVTDVDEDAVYDVSEQVYMQKTDVDEEWKRSRLQGLKDRLSGMETDRAEDLRADIEALEGRIDDLLAAG